jgi:putative tryptophan/tyrosine transport system substrate-binding protein
MSTRQKSILVVIVLALIAGLAWMGTHRPTYGVNGDDKRQLVIYVASVVEIEPIAELRDGFKEAVAQSSFGKRVRYVERNAQGDAGLMAQIANEIAKEKPDLVYVLGTPLAQAIQKRAPDVTLVQGAVTDPVEAGLANSWNGSGKRYAANSDRPPTDRIVSLIRTLTPTVQTVGFLYNPSETNSVAVLRSLKADAAKSGLNIKEFSVARATDIPAAMNAAVTTSDALFIPPDNTVTAGIKGIIQTASGRAKPVFATTTDAVGEGALAGVTTDFRTLGREAATIAISILGEGKDPAKIPIALPAETAILINRATLERLGLSPPASLRYEFFKKAK